MDRTHALDLGLLAGMALAAGDHGKATALERSFNVRLARAGRDTAGLQRACQAGYHCGKQEFHQRVSDNCNLCGRRPPIS